jgi:dienelactone hydrolase
LKPIDSKNPLPGVLALHDHGGFKYFGKEKIADGPSKPVEILETHRALVYGGRAFANALAREGFAVLVHDTFTWGSRRFPLEVIPEKTRLRAESYQAWGFQDDWPQQEIVFYNAAACIHEESIEKVCTTLGTSFAGVVSYEDRVAMNYMFSRPDIDAERVGCIGLSGGGARAAYLQATCTAVKACVIVGMMSTYEELLDRHFDSHGWLFFPPWGRYGDWPDLVASRAPSPLLVQFSMDDELFSEEGMRAADHSIKEHYRRSGRQENYVGEFYPGPHKFDMDMQAASFEWLKQQLIA